MMQRLLRPARAFSTAANASCVTLEKQGTIGILRLNDPNRLNALTADMGDRVEELVQEIAARADEFSAIVLTGEGRAFSAGGDLDFLTRRSLDTPTRNSVTMRKFYGRFLTLRSLPVPLIAALNGPAIGAGMCISLFADVRVAAKDAKLGFTFVHLGLHPVISGEEAHQYGLVSKVVDKEDVVLEAIKIAQEMTSGSSVATRSLLRLIALDDVETFWQDEGLERALWREADSQANCYATADYREGVDAIKTKRKPHFQMLEHYKEM
ncbi:enoyl-CoA hydratase/isomerase [Achlya hypogyna]|uniref:Enoyl-CoA hydratase/isomerase n=1 Tax=Achlya hypogyna TaxID=1202772 RepID=A0A1V9Z190_ACHHY|nr:enoyl-CoA hydratase/isomerase [Achlya hypogyna]